MENLFKNNHFYPQNFFIPDAKAADIDKIIQQIAEKANEISPQSFDAQCLYFVYKLRYQPPYVKISEFNEIKNLQIEAISHTRFRNEYNGYIGIDLSEWVEHADEEHFINCILALKSMCNNWKYVFFVQQDYPEVSIQTMLYVIKNRLWLHELKMNTLNGFSFADTLCENMKQNYNINVSDDSKRMINAIFKDTDFSNSVASAMADDISIYCGNIRNLLEENLVNYLQDDTYAHFIMSEKEFAKLKDFIKEREEK